MQTEERKEMSMNGGIFARISPLSERILAIVTRVEKSQKGGKLDPFEKRREAER